MVILPLDDLRARARRIAAVLTDSDGTLTDGGVYYSEKGEALKRFCLRDGMGFELLRTAGIKTAIVTREASGFIRARAEDLRVDHGFFGVTDKRAHLAEIERALGVPASAMAYLGDDVNDVDIMRAIGTSGLVGAPADALPPARELAHRVTTSSAGHGAFREFADWIVALRGDL